jgi:hypothetical protein
MSSHSPSSSRTPSPPARPARSSPTSRSRASASAPAHDAPHRDQAGEFYAVHRERPFYGSLVSFMTSGPCIPCCWSGRRRGRAARGHRRDRPRRGRARHRPRPLRRVQGAQRHPRLRLRRERGAEAAFFFADRPFANAAGWERGRRLAADTGSLAAERRGVCGVPVRTPCVRHAAAAARPKARPPAGARLHLAIDTTGIPASLTTMLKVDLGRLARQHRVRIDLEVPADDPLWDGRAWTFDGPVRGAAGRAAGGRGRGGAGPCCGAVELACRRCLKPVPHELDEELTFVYRPGRRGGGGGGGGLPAAGARRGSWT